MCAAALRGNAAGFPVVLAAMVGRTVLERHGLDRFLVDADNNDYDGYHYVDGWLFCHRRVFF